jgi:hypothetical protein
MHRRPCTMPLSLPLSECDDTILLGNEDSGALLAELHRLRLELKSKDDHITSQRAKFDALELKMKNSIEHRDAVIAQLAASRKLVFEECHLACVRNQDELRQLQDALHRVTRQLHRERRDLAARCKSGSTDLRRGTAPRSSSSLSLVVQKPRLQGVPEDSSMDEALGLETSSVTQSDDDDLAVLCLDEIVSPPLGPPSPSGLNALPRSGAGNCGRWDGEEDDDELNTATSNADDDDEEDRMLAELLAWS